MAQACAVTRGARSATMLAPARPAPGNQAPLVVPEAVKNTEDLTLWLHREARGKRVDLQGRALRPKGGYEKDVYGLDWHEHPHPHWYLPFVPAGTTLANGTVVVSPRIALVCEGPGVVLEDLSIEGLGDPSDDARNALLVQGTTSDLTARNCTFTGVGVYVWNGADAALERCTMTRGLHGLYVWGRSEVSAQACTVTSMEQSGFNIRDGATVTLTDCTSTGAKVGSGVWVGANCKVTVAGCTLRGNESYGVEANHSKAVVTVSGSDLAGNCKGEQDTWDGGKVDVKSAPAA